jgi:hypothetical protein
MFQTINRAIIRLCKGLRETNGIAQTDYGPINGLKHVVVVLLYIR